MDRITWFVHGNDAQSRAQAILVARHQEINWEAIYEWAENDGIDVSVIEAIERQAASS
jgi:chaperone required for assembly of F1-ATPase